MDYVIFQIQRFIHEIITKLLNTIQDISNNSFIGSVVIPIWQ